MFGTKALMTKRMASIWSQLSELFSTSISLRSNSTEPTMKVFKNDFNPIPPSHHILDAFLRFAPKVGQFRATIQQFMGVGLHTAVAAKCEDVLFHIGTEDGTEIVKVVFFALVEVLGEAVPNVETHLDQLKKKC